MTLFNAKTVARHVAAAPQPSPDTLSVLRDWADTITSRSIHNLNETQVESKFLQEIVINVLGYSGGPKPEDSWSVQSKQQIGAGEVDLALGEFTGAHRSTIAPFELKGARIDLDAIMPGRAKTPVQQAFEYANNNAGTKWVLVSNFVELRLYSYGEGTQAFEPFDLARLHEPDECKRFLLLLSQDQLLGGATAALLEESRAEDKDISEQLYADYKRLRGELIGAVDEAKPDIDPLDTIAVAQTILDRVLFIAFAEDNGLIPDGTIGRAYDTQNQFNPQPVWQNFLGLFRAVDDGDEGLNIPRYNGGLFSRDPIINDLSIPDPVCEGFKNLARYDFASEVPVTVLGRIFEQSITDIEKLQAEARGEPVEEASGVTGRRKRDGVVYTPDRIARFIVERTIGAHLAELFDGLLAKHARKGTRADDDPIKWKSAKDERDAWTAYRDRLSSLRIVDPACGSGVFLVTAFDFLKDEMTRVNDVLARLSGTGQIGDLYDPTAEILTHNLFGVDVNSESVEIAKLSLWIKTARRGKVLDSLNENIKVGDSLIEDSNYAYLDHGFTWAGAFPQVPDGRFDIVLGNPPYVRMGLIKAMKPYLERRYEVASDRADLYAYFFERGLTLLKEGGRLGYISSSTFFKTGSGGPLRNFLRTEATIEAVIDFGDLQVFEGVTTYPVIMTMVRGSPPADHSLRFWNVYALPEDQFGDAFEEHARPFPQAELGSGSWELEGDALRQLREKIVRGRPTLKEVYGSPLYGIKTGLNKAFVIDDETKRRLCREDARSAELLKPFLEGKDINRWRVEPRGRWIIYIPKNRVDIDDYPAIRDWLLPFKKSLERRAARQNWYELQQAQEKYVPAMTSDKIVYSRFLVQSDFTFDASDMLINNALFCFPTSDHFLLALLNSRVCWFHLRFESTDLQGGFSQADAADLDSFAVPAATQTQRSELSALAQTAQTAAETRLALQREVTRRIPDLAPADREAKLTNKLKSWWTLPDFAAFQKEIKKAFKGVVPLKERNEWESWMAETRAAIEEQTAIIEVAEAEINAKVYALFELTDDEIKVLEDSL